MLPSEARHQTGAAEPVIASSEAAIFHRSFNRSQFSFCHRLARHPMLDLPRLEQLAERILEEKDGRRFAAFEAVAESPSTKFSELRRQPSTAEKIRSISTGRSWLRLTNVQQLDRRYQELHDRILDEAESLSGRPLRGKIGWSSTTIVVSSPGVVTPYHIDHQSNLLFQIQGEKTVHLFDPADRRVIAEEEIERYYAGDFNAANYRADMQSAGTSHRLAPGQALHNPPLAPHWVENGNEVSVSLSLNFSLREFESRARIYQANYFLRRLGLRPSVPGASPLRDALKAAAFKPGAKTQPGSVEELVRSWATRASQGRTWLRRALDDLRS
jgi:cupin-like protein